MKELSLYILDIAMNSIRAKAENVSVIIRETAETFDLTIKDDGCGMTEEQLEKLADPFFTTRTTRKVGLGVPFLKMAAEQTGGYVKISSKSEKQYTEHGTVVSAHFYKKHIDFTPLGDIAETVVTLIQGNPKVNFIFVHTNGEFEVKLDTAKLREFLGEDISLSDFEVLGWIRDFLKEQYEHN